MSKTTSLLTLLLAASLMGCASYFKRKECEKINWFDYGQKVALRGDRLDADSGLNECRKVEADISESQLDLGFKSGMQKYCDPANAYQVGRKGDPFVRDLCEGPTIRSLLNEHHRGIGDYCKNGSEAGASGKKYGHVCTPEQEKTFLPLYKQGRKRYVETVIQDKETLIREKDGQITGLTRERDQLEGRRSQLQTQRSSLEAQKMHWAAQATPLAASQTSMLTNQLGAVDSELSSTDSALRNKRSSLSQRQSERDKLRQEISDLKTELVILDTP